MPLCYVPTELTPQRLDGLRDLALRAETVAIHAGLDFGRDIGTL